MRFLPLILRNSWRNRRRTLLTIASIGVSMCLLGVMIAMYSAFWLAKPKDNQALRLVVRNRVSLAVFLPIAYRQQIERIPGVRLAMVDTWFGGQYKDAREARNNFPRFSVEPEKLFPLFAEWTIPEDQKQAFIQERTACVIGRDLANAFNFHLGDRIPIQGDIFPGNFEFTVRGIFEAPANSDVMYFNKEYIAQAMPERRRGEVDTFYVLIDDPQHSAAIADAIDAQFRNSTSPTKTESEQAFVIGFLSMLGNVRMFLVWISAAVMFTILLVSANTMAMSVRERVREVGVLKTLGFTEGTILGLILGEAVAISVAGGAIGYLISTVLLKGVERSPMGGFLPALRVFDPLIAAVCILLAGLIGLVSSLVPAMGASRAPIVEALRSTD
ncbi:MAG: FtsX-like permease family protein [Bryobacteraceae bacterium]|jgi:putative ABC transport system permease protein